MTATAPSIVLASASPARLKLLLAAGVQPVVRVSAVDEDAVLAAAREHSSADISPRDVSQLLATAKARDVAAALRTDSERGNAFVVGCDSVLEWDGREWGKPGTADVARERLRAMAGTNGVLHTGHCVINVATGELIEEVGSTQVGFADMTPSEIDAYVATGEPLQVAGSFTLDGLASPFIDGIVGDPSNVIGLSMPLLRRVLKRFGVEWFSLT